MAIEFIGGTITLDAASVGSVIVGFSIPENAVKKYKVTGLADTREKFKQSAMFIEQVFNFTVRYDTELKPVATGDSGSWIVTPPKQTAGSAAAETNTFTGFVEIAGPIEGSVDTTEGVTQDFTVFLTTENAVVVEA